MKRKALYAGSFYTRNAQTMINDMDTWSSAAIKAIPKGRILGIIVPHAGLMYSGACASYAYQCLSNQRIESIIILHPCHKANHFDYSVSPFEEYETPLGTVKRDEDIYTKLVHRSTKIVETSLHEVEHSLEIQLPFVKHFFPQVPINGIMIGNQSLEVARSLALMLLDLMAKTDKRIAIVVSTDLSHYRTSSRAEAYDVRLIDYVKRLDPQGLWQAVIKKQCEACGIGAILTLLNMANRFTSATADILHYTHSGIVAGNNDQVVGYLSAAISL